MKRFLVLALVLPALLATGESPPAKSAKPKKPKHHTPKGPSAILKRTDDVTVKLDVSIIDQEGWYMCWSTCGEMVMDAIGPERVAQCEQAAHAENVGRADCCQGDILKGLCDNPGYPDFPFWGNLGTVVSVGTPLSWDSIVAEIDGERRPFCHGFSLGDEVNHMMVVRGYQIVDGVKYLLCLNPRARASTIEKTVEFEVYRGPGVGGFGHDRDFWKIKP